MNDPLFTNVMWSVGRGATLAQLTPVFAGLVAGQLQAAGLDAATAQAQAGALAAALPSLIPEQLGGLNNSLMSLNLKLRLEMRRLFDPVADAYDVPFTRSTNTHTFELGYKGVLGNKLAVAADAYRTTTENFGGPLAVETPNVFLEPTSLAAALGPGIAAAMADPANAQVAGAVAALMLCKCPALSRGTEMARQLTRLRRSLSGERLAYLMVRCRPNRPMIQRLSYWLTETLVRSQRAVLI